MKEILLGIVGFFILVPFLPMFISRKILNRFVKNKRKAKRIAFEIATPFFLLAIYALLDVIYDVKILWIIFLIILILAMITTVVQWKINDEVQILKIARSTIRIVFPISFFVYIILMCNGLIVYYLNYIYK
ncbi:MAG TPA: DUF3397 domain-containing protein [Firmicutes bacterium]|nr:DUF3397 family protein [Bacillales bacterium]HJA41332.1 DUF3397 domain-containing protein [Bacillota bacterium]